MSFGKRQPTGFRGVERRRAVREQTDLTAHVTLPAGQTVKCRLTEFSKTGARLAVASAFGLPDTFALSAASQTYHGEIVRRGIGYVAVNFV
jgi:hypothetical protein